MKLTIKLSGPVTTEKEQWLKFIEELKEFEEAIYSHQIEPCKITNIKVIDECFDAIKSGLRYLQKLNPATRTEFEGLEVKVDPDELFEAILIFSDRFMKKPKSTRIGAMVINNLLDFLSSFCFEQGEDIETHLAYNDLKNEKRGEKQKLYVSESDIKMFENMEMYSIPCGYKRDFTTLLKSLEN